MKASFGILYKFPFIYPIAMKFLYGKAYNDRYEKIAEVVKHNSTVIDVCCGDAKLYQYLKSKNICYTGLDISKSFVKSLNKKGIPAKVSDVRIDKIPDGDYVIMQGSLYQFQNHSALIKKLFKSSKQALIISEPIKNLKDSTTINTFLYYLIPFIVGTENKNKHFRFNEKEFKKLISDYNPEYVSIKSKRDIIAIIKKRN